MLYKINYKKNEYIKLNFILLKSVFTKGELYFLYLFFLGKGTKK